MLAGTAGPADLVQEQIDRRSSAKGQSLADYAQGDKTVVNQTMAETKGSVMVQHGAARTFVRACTCRSRSTACRARSTSGVPRPAAFPPEAVKMLEQVAHLMAEGRPTVAAASSSVDDHEETHLGGGGKWSAPRVERLAGHSRWQQAGGRKRGGKKRATALGFDRGVPSADCSAGFECLARAAVLNLVARNRPRSLERSRDEMDPDGRTWPMNSQREYSMRCRCNVTHSWKLAS